MDADKRRWREHIYLRSSVFIGGLNSYEYELTCPNSNPKSLISHPHRPYVWVISFSLSPMAGVSISAVKRQPQLPPGWPGMFMRDASPRPIKSCMVTTTISLRRTS